MIKDTHPMGSRPPQPPSRVHQHHPVITTPEQPAPLDITPDQLIGRLGITLKFEAGDAINELTAAITFDGIEIDTASCYVDPAGYVVDMDRGY
jgi:hypothetical protein